MKTGIGNCSQIVFIVACELDAFLDQMISDSRFQNRPSDLKQKQIDCYVSKILHTLSYRHAKIFSSALVKDVAKFLKSLTSDSGFIVNAILDSDVCPQTKCDAFKHCYDSTMSRINSYYC